MSSEPSISILSSLVTWRSWIYWSLHIKAEKGAIWRLLVKLCESQNPLGMAWLPGSKILINGQFWRGEFLLLAYSQSSLYVELHKIYYNHLHIVKWLSFSNFNRWIILFLFLFRWTKSPVHRTARSHSNKLDFSSVDQRDREKFQWSMVQSPEPKMLQQNLSARASEVFFIVRNSVK